MLKIVTEIVFFEPNYNPNGKKGYDAKLSLRPVFKFCENRLHSGIIENDQKFDSFFFGEMYPLRVSFPWIEDKEFCKDINKRIGEKIPVQVGGRLIGEAKLIECFWEE